MGFGIRDSGFVRRVALMAGAFVLFGALPLQAQVKVGDLAPGAAMETLDGKPAELGAYIGKKPVLIEFWAAWCSTCKALEPQMHAAHRAFGDSVHFVAVAVSVNQSPARVKAHLSRHPMPLTVLYDRRGKASGAYGVFATSTIVIADRTGRITYVGQGEDQDIVGEVRRALAWSR